MTTIPSRSHRFFSTSTERLSQGQYQDTRTGKRIELALPTHGAVRRNPADRRA